MIDSTPAFSLYDTLHQLRHYLPTQASLKDFVHHNTLHAFQDEPFEKAIWNASALFGYKVSLSLAEYRKRYAEGEIDITILENVILERKGSGEINHWLTQLLEEELHEELQPKVGVLRTLWKDAYHIDLNTIVHTNLFRILNSYLDQGIAITKFPNTKQTFLESIIDLEQNSLVSFFKTKSARNKLINPHLTIEMLLDRLVGDERLYEHYLFDQQFAHPGWSGLVATIETQPNTLLDGRKISLEELILLECLLEIDNLDHTLGTEWAPLAAEATAAHRLNIFESKPQTHLQEILTIWQQAFEWSYYDQVLAGIQLAEARHDSYSKHSFQALFCIDDRSCSLRRYMEHFDPECATFGTPGHFGIDTYYQPKNGKFYTKVCPVPIQPKHLIKEISTNKANGSDVHFTKSTHSLFSGWLISQTLGFWSAIKLIFTIFKPRVSPANSFSFSHMDENSSLIVENRSPQHTHDGLQIGYTIHEMTDRVETVLRSIGLIEQFAPLVYVVGHGASSANNTHYAGYDCGACSGRPGSANARAFSYMANHKEVRIRLADRGVHIPVTTEFVGGLHDTTRDEFRFYDEELLAPKNMERHLANKETFKKAGMANAKERSRRFASIDTRWSVEKIHKKVKERSVSLFEPRPELNHATNALCVIGRKRLHDHLFLDRRAFLNSYNYLHDMDGRYLQTIVNAAAPVCGGINLEYYFSRVDNEKLGAGTKLPHNVMGLIAVANGFEGDLRTGLPLQMIEVHDPIRLLMIIEHLPDVALHAIQQNTSTYEWFANGWINLCVINPEDGWVYRFRNEQFEQYEPATRHLRSVIVEELEKSFETNEQNLPVYQLK